MQQPDRREVVLGTGEAGPGEPGHESAGPDMQRRREPADGRGLGGEAHQALDEEPGVGSGLAEGGEHGPLDPRGGTGGRERHRLPQPGPAGRQRDVHHLADAGRPEAQQHLARGGIVLRQEGDGGNAREVAHQVADGVDLLRCAVVHRDEHGVHRALPHHAHRLGHAVAVHHGEDAAARRVHPLPLRCRQHGGDGEALPGVCHVPRPWLGEGTR